MKVDLPQPVGPDQERELAPLDGQRDAVEPDVAAGIDDGDVAQLDCGGPFRRRPARGALRFRSCARSGELCQMRAFCAVAAHRRQAQF